MSKVNEGIVQGAIRLKILYEWTHYCSFLSVSIMLDLGLLE